jgi:Rrf2 family nitric oxide-sensitive transcriptional repressor
MSKFRPMQLTRHTDYALRLLICLARADGERMAIAEVAQRQNISRTHLMKIANQLAHTGFIEATRGRGGGIRLARDPGQINIGAVIAAMEPGCDLVNCATCQLVGGCGLPKMFGEAMQTFMATLGKYSLADVIGAGTPGLAAA